MDIKITFLSLISVITLLDCDTSKSSKTDTITQLLYQEASSLITIQPTSKFTIQANNLLIGKIESPVLIHEKTGDLIYYDSIMNQILVTDSKGKLKTFFGRKGSGPKEFRHITSFGVYQDTIYVLDANLDMIKQFNTNGILLNEYRALTKDKLWARSNRLYIHKDYVYAGVQQAEFSSSNNHWKSKIIAKYDLNGNLIGIFGDYDPTLENSSRLYKNGNITLDPKNELFYTTHRTSPYINVYDLNTQGKIARFSAISKFFNITKEEARMNDSREVRDQKILNMSAVRDHFITDDYFIFYFYNFTQDFWDTRNNEDLIFYIQVFDKESFKFLGEINLPHELLGVNNNDELLLIEDENPDNFTIGTYEINTKK